MSGSIVQIETQPLYNGNEEARGVKILHRVFWSFNPYIRVFRHCKPLVQVDGTHIYGKYKGTLMVAVARDGNQNIVPITFALVEGEIADAWHFFLTNLRMNVFRRDGVCMISDQHELIWVAINCSGGYSRTVEECNINYKRLKERGEAYARWCDTIGLRHWRIETNMQIVVHRFDRQNEVFGVHEMTSRKVLVVDLERRTCDCGHFQVERLPCRHVIACCANQHFDWQLYVHDVYKMIEVRKVYRFEITPLGDPETWPAYEGPTLVANPALR
ncbi:uncharacterized protein [Arachis hypogaea]|uniref:uncharacterized protein n=1 Tax=Arachis hypogaea TaxID=3818 RepID=UPI003B21A06B